MNAQFVRVLKRSLPGELTAEQGEELGSRLAQRCTFPPTIAEILDEWRVMRRDMRRREAMPPPVPVRRNPAVARQVRAVRDLLQQGRPLPRGEVTPELRDFARRFFPDISDESIRRNWLEIANCMYDRQEQERTKSSYQTVMELEPDGTICLAMRMRTMAG